MEILVYLLVIVTVSVFVLLIHSILFGQREAVLSRLGHLKRSFNDPEDDAIMSQPFRDRIIKPAYQKFVAFIGRATPNGLNNNIEQYIAYAGSPGNVTVNRLLAIMIMAGLLFSIIGGLIFGINGRGLLVTIIFAVLGFIIPIYVIRAMARNRQSKIQRALPDMLDLIYVSVEAGLAFDMALKRTTEKMPGPLSYEFNLALDEINKGRKREESFRSVVYRTGVGDVSTFISAVIQSEQLGSNIANMLRVQSTSMRQKRRQRAEQEAMKIPIKMLFPLVFFMLPALFIVILGPAIIRILGVLGDMF